MRKHRKSFWKIWRQRFYFKSWKRRWAMTLGTVLLALGITGAEGFQHAPSENAPIEPTTQVEWNASGNVSAQAVSNWGFTSWVLPTSSPASIHDLDIVTRLRKARITLYLSPVAVPSTPGPDSSVDTTRPPSPGP